MPLIHSKSKEAFSKNVSAEMHAHPNMDQKQAVAIAYSVQRHATKDDADESRIEKHAHEKFKYGR